MNVLFDGGANDARTAANALRWFPDAQYAARFGQASRRIGVHCTTLDRFCADNGIDAIDVLKIDTEGFELEVLKGAQDVLNRRRIRFIYAELNDMRTQEHGSGGGLMPIDELIRPHGLRFAASYNDHIVTEDDMFAVSNALFAPPPGAA